MEVLGPYSDPLSALPKSAGLDNIPDGATYQRMPGANMDVNRRALIDFSQAAHLNKNLDNIADTGSHLRGSTIVDTAGALQIDNANCSLPANANGSLPGWDGSTLSAGASWYVDTGPDAGYTQDYVLETPTAAVGQIYSLKKWTCRPGDSVSITARVRAASGIYSGALISFYNASGAYVASVAAASTSTTWSTISSSGTAPANTVYAQLVVYCSAPSSGRAFVAIQWIRASINDVRVAGSGAYGYVNFADNTAGGHNGKSLANIPDDAGSARYAVFAVDANRRALIDFSQSGHINKLLSGFPVVLFKSSAKLAVALSSTSASLFPTGVGSLTVAANSLAVGDSLRATIAGYVASVPSAVSAIYPTVTLGAATAGSSSGGEGIIATSANGFPFRVDVLITCLSIGASGSIVVSFRGSAGQIRSTTASQPTEWSDSSVGATLALNTTIANALNVLLAASVACNLLVTSARLEQL